MADNSGTRGPLMDFYASLSAFEKLVWGFVIGTYLVAVLVSFSKLVTGVLAGNIQVASSWAGIVTGLATIGLVIVTGLYVIYTRKLVGVMRDTQGEERSYRQKRRKRKINSLRKALLQEISAMEDLDELAENYEPRYSVYRQVAPTEVFKANASDIGLLTGDEIETVVEYYGLASMINDLLALQRDLDTKYGSGIIEQASRKYLFDVSEETRELRTGTIADRIGELYDAQIKAINKLQTNLQPPIDSREEGNG